ncbi:DUF2637 domain-containing protein [Paractinoplanes rishiriensis]|uniref:DUF2637 domain-containing protein n=1 Tax=Paractinoplanes rishiriensis TaxID=1050105 RepID=A0A919JU69_9ACTN|nr:hypothetical protein Ari01nite_08970 [Actinoplanes rishiriensis]
MVLRQLRRVRWAVRATLFLGVAASVVANILHALDNPISQAIAAWPPLALLLTVELISRVPVHRPILAAARLLATATIAGIAAWVSYWHMAGVAARYGETGASPYLLPLSVDGLIVVASICLVELGGRIQSLENPPTPATTPVSAPPAAVVPVAAGLPAHAATAAGPASGGGSPDDWAKPIPGLVPAPSRSAAAPATAIYPGNNGNTPLRRTTAAALAEAAAALPRANQAPANPAFTPALTRRQAGQPRPAAAAGPARSAARPAPGSGRPAPGNGRPAPGNGRPVPGNGRLAPGNGRPAPGNGRSVPAQRSASATAKVTRPANAGAGSGKPARARRSPAETLALADQLKAARPAMTDTEIAAELGITTSRLRTVRREATQPTLAA